jgi:hypothetical protein
MRPENSSWRRRFLFDVIDHQHLNRSLFLLDLQPEQGQSELLGPEPREQGHRAQITPSRNWLQGLAIQTSA